MTGVDICNGRTFVAAAFLDQTEVVSFACDTAVRFVAYPD